MGDMSEIIIMKKERVNVLLSTPPPHIPLGFTTEVSVCELSSFSHLSNESLYDER